MTGRLTENAMKTNLKTWIGNYGIDLELPFEQAQGASHPGPCDADVATLLNDPAIKAQTDKWDPESLRLELKEYGAWGAEELADHAANISRAVWLACGNISDEGE
jgi:hypothetical protein